MKWKTHLPLKELNGQAYLFPVPSKKINHTLVILPKQLEYLDPAVELVNELQQEYPYWRYMMLDMDKVIGDKLNRLHLPSSGFISKLKKENFELVIDLNPEFDYRIGYLIALLRIPYRIYLLPDIIPFYNINIKGNFFQIKNYRGLISYLKTIFTK
jgi:hypothetical protein